MRVVIVDDHAIVREGVRLMLEGDDRFEIVGEASDGAELRDLLSRVAADIVLLDLRMEGVGGLEVLEELGNDPDAPGVVVLTMHDGPGYLRRAVELGARGYVLKHSGRAELIRAMELVAAGGAHVDPQLAETLVVLARGTGEETTDLDGDSLTLVRLLTAGNDNRSIMEVTGWTESQLRTRLKTLYERLGVANRTEAVAVALRRRLVD
jgi:DNA-binding NarL/FixJ family response regulator